MLAVSNHRFRQSLKVSFAPRLDSMPQLGHRMAEPLSLRSLHCDRCR